MKSAAKTLGLTCAAVTWCAAIMVLVHKVGWDAHFMQRSPWFWPLGRAAKSFETHSAWPTPGDYDALYAALALPKGARPLVFRENVRKQDKRRDGHVAVEELYDARITLRGEVPTREDNWHDFFNAACFATFPRAKLALHARQYAALAARLSGATQIPNARTPEQDALTLFDEGGAIIAVTSAGAPQLTSAPAAERAIALQELQASGAARVIPFGHALFEHLVEGLRCPGGCTQVLTLVELPADDDALLDLADVALAAALGDPTRFVSSRECSHLRLEVAGVIPMPVATLASGSARPGWPKQGGVD